MFHCESDAEAENRVRQLQSAIDKANHAQKSSYTLSVSIGYARLEDDREISPGEVIRRADKMMYKNKQGRRG